MVKQILSGILGPYTMPVILAGVLVGIASLYGWHVWSVNAAYKDGVAQGAIIERAEWVNRVKEARNMRRRELSAAQDALLDLHKKFETTNKKLQEQRIRSQAQLSNLLSTIGKEKNNDKISNPYTHRVDTRIVRELNKGRVGAR